MCGLGGEADTKQQTHRRGVAELCAGEGEVHVDDPGQRARAEIIQRQGTGDCSLDVMSHSLTTPLAGFLWIIYFGLVFFTVFTHSSFASSDLNQIRGGADTISSGTVVRLEMTSVGITATLRAAVKLATVPA
jgi:hypothetical protein